MCKWVVQQSRPRPKSGVAQWNRKEWWWHRWHHENTITFEQMVMLLQYAVPHCHWTRELFCTDPHDIIIHNKCNRGRRGRQGKKDEDNLVTTQKNFKLFSRDVPQELQNIVTKDLASKNVEEDLLMAQQKGQEQTDTFAGQRLLPCIERKVKFRDILTKHKSLTWAKLMSTVEHRKQSRQKEHSSETNYHLQSRMQGGPPRDLEAWTDAHPYLLLQKLTAVCIQGQRQYCFKSPHMNCPVHTALTPPISATAQLLFLPLGCFSTQPLLETWLTLLSSLSCKLDVLSSTSTSCLTDFMRLQ